MSFGSNFTVSVEICQLRYYGDSWSDVPPQENQDIEFSFCVPFNDACVVKVKSILQFISFLPESCIFQYNLFFDVYYVAVLVGAPLCSVRRSQTILLLF